MPHSAAENPDLLQGEPHAADCYVCNSHVHFDSQENQWVMKQEDKNCIEHPKRLPPKVHVKDVSYKKRFIELNNSTVLWRVHRGSGRVLGLQYWHTVESNYQASL